MTDYAICFDFPEHPDPWFAKKLRDGAGFTTSLVDADKFSDETAAERMLKNAYGDNTRKWGAVVEVGQ